MRGLAGAPFRVQAGRAEPAAGRMRGCVAAVVAAEAAGRGGSGGGGKHAASGDRAPEAGPRSGHSVPAPSLLDGRGGDHAPQRAGSFGAAQLPAGA